MSVENNGKGSKRCSFRCFKIFLVREGWDRKTVGIDKYYAMWKYCHGLNLVSYLGFLLHCLDCNQSLSLAHFFHLFTLASLSLESEKSDSMQSAGKVMAK